MASEKKFHCSNCRENKLESLGQVTRTSVGEGRDVVLCKECQCVLSVPLDIPVQKK